MKTLMQRTLATLSATGALLLTSCIDVKQDIWINADGGGRLILDMGISKQALEMLNSLSQLGGEDAGEGNPLTQDPEKTASDLRKSEYVTDVKWAEKEDEKYKRQIYTVEISDITRIGEIMEENPLSSSLQELAGDNAIAAAEGDEFSIEKTASGTYKLSAVSKGQQQEDQDPIQALMMKQMFGDAKLTVRVHAPAISHNGEKQEDGSILWALPLADVTTGFDFKGEFEAPKPPPAPEEKSGGGTNMKLLLVLAGVILVVVVVVITKAQKPKAAADPPATPDLATPGPAEPIDPRQVPLSPTPSPPAKPEETTDAPGEKN